MRGYLRDTWDDLVHDPIGWVLAASYLLPFVGLTARGCL